MEHAIKKSITLSILLCVTISFLFSCKKQKEETATQPPAEEAVTIKTSPSKAESPTLEGTVEEISARLFAKKTLANVNASAIGTTDLVDFNDEMALTILPDHAASTFATAPFYIQQVGTAWVHVKENNSGNYKPAFKSNYGHYHLSYENFIPCITPGGQFGKPVAGACASMNPVKEPRVLNTHNGNEWIKIYAYDYISSSRVFDLLGIKVTKGPIQLWYRKSNGDWYHWSSLGVGTWNLSAHSTSIKEVLISSTGNKDAIGFDNVKVLVPNF